MTALPVVPFERERYVVLPILDGVADVSVLHLPAAIGFTGTFADRIERGFPPPSWPSACGQVDRGSIYVQAGPLARIEVCSACQAALASPGRIAA